MRLPVAISFTYPVITFGLKVGGLGGFLSLDAYDAQGELVDRTPIILSNPIQPFSVSGGLISRIVLNGDEFMFFMVDDLV